MIDKYPRIANDDSQLTQFKNDVIAGEYGGSSVELAGNSLVIPEQEGPQLVITIDGIDYYHKQEFDLTIYNRSDLSKCFNLLTGEQFASSGTPSIAHLSIFPYGPGYPSGSITVQLALGAQYGHSLYIIERGTSVVPDLNYTSRAFTVVDTQQEVTNDSKICLPTCSAYYGFLSEDGKTFISYYNLKTDGAPEYVDSIKQGNAVIPMKDDRLPAAEAADAGKVLKVADAGGYELGEAGGSGGTQLYKHSIACMNTSLGRSRVICNIISSSSTPVTDTDTWNALVGESHQYDDIGVLRNDDGSICCGFYSGMKNKFVYRLYTDLATYTDEEYSFSDHFSDTVREL